MPRYSTGVVGFPPAAPPIPDSKFYKTGKRPSGTRGVASQAVADLQRLNVVMLMAETDDIARITICTARSFVDDFVAIPVGLHQWGRTIFIYRKNPKNKPRDKAIPRILSIGGRHRVIEAPRIEEGPAPF